LVDLRVQLDVVAFGEQMVMKNTERAISGILRPRARAFCRIGGGIEFWRDILDESKQQILILTTSLTDFR
jgi:hypothetical protein